MLQDQNEDFDVKEGLVAEENTQALQNAKIRRVKMQKLSEKSEK
jgi:hypothetical protein